MEYATPKDEYIATPPDASGRGITLKNLSQKWAGHRGCSLKNLKRRSAKEGWRKLRRSFWEKALERRYQKEAEKIGETVGEAKHRYLRIVQAAIGKLVEAMKEEKLNYSLSDLEKLARLELLLRGEPTEVKQIRSVIEVNVQVLETVVADCIKALLQENYLSRDGARVFAEYFAKGINTAPFQYDVMDDPAQKFGAELAIGPKCEALFPKRMEAGAERSLPGSGFAPEAGEEDS